MKRILLLSLCLLAQSLLNAQGWRSRHLFGLTDLSRCIFETTAGSYIGIGDKLDSNGVATMCVMGLDNLGQLQWKKEYQSSQLLYGQGYVSNYGYKRGNYIYYTRYSVDYQDSSGVAVLLKFDFNGDTLWQKVYRDTLWDIVPQQVTGSVDGGLLITGVLTADSLGMPCMVIKTDADGNQLWKKIIHNTQLDYAQPNAILQDSASKKIIIVGYHQNAAYAYRSAVMILDSLGNKLEERDYMGGPGGNWNDIIQTADKKIVVAGTRSFAFDEYHDPISQPYAIKFDLDAGGPPIWEFELPGQAFSGGFNSVKAYPEGALIFSGGQKTTDTVNILVDWLISFTKLSDGGQLIWNHYYDYKTVSSYAEIDQSPCNISITSDHGFVSAIENAVPQPGPFLFVKYDGNGCDSTQGYCATNYTWTGVKEIAGKKLDLSVYPNPASGSITIDLPQDRIFDLKLINMLGANCSEVLLAEKHTKLQLKQLQPGIYFLQAYEYGRLVGVKKIIRE